MLRRARLAAGERCLIVGIGGGVSTAALHLAVRMGAEVHVTSRDPAKGEAALALGAAAAHDSGAEFPVKAHVVVESVGPGHLGPVGAGAPARAAAWWCAAAPRARRSRSPSPGCSSSSTSSSARRWAPTGSSPRSPT